MIDKAKHPTADPALLAIIDQLNLLEQRLERIELRQAGVCPECRVKPGRIALTVTDREFPAWSAKQREKGIDPGTGHGIGCAEAIGS